MVCMVGTWERQEQNIDDEWNVFLTDLHYYFFKQVVKNNLNPVWRPFKISLNSLCYGDMDKTIKVI